MILFKWNGTWAKYIRPLSDAVFTIASDDLWIERFSDPTITHTANLPNMQRVVGMPDLHPGRGYRLAQRSSLLVVLPGTGRQ